MEERPKINKIAELKIRPRLRWKSVQLCCATKFSTQKIVLFLFSFFLLFCFENLILPAERRRCLKNKSTKKRNFWSDFQHKKGQCLDAFSTLQHIYAHAYGCVIEPHCWQFEGEYLNPIFVSLRKHYKNRGFKASQCHSPEAKGTCCHESIA